MPFAVRLRNIASLAIQSAEYNVKIDIQKLSATPTYTDVRILFIDNSGKTIATASTTTIPKTLNLKLPAGKYKIQVWDSKRGNTSIVYEVSAKTNNILIVI